MTINRGRLSKDQATKSPKLIARNWECGVIVTVATTSSPTTERSGMLDAFQGSVQIPMTLPGAAFQDDGREPFFGDEP